MTDINDLLNSLPDVVDAEYDAKIIMKAHMKQKMIKSKSH